MGALLGPVVLLGLADSLNPATIAVAVVLATGRRPVPRLALFALGTGGTYLLGGLVLVLGPAGLLHALIHHTPGTAGHIGEIIAGLVGVAIGVWVFTRDPAVVSKHVSTDLSPGRAFVLGVGITLVDLPTALMYFGAIALLTDSELPIHTQVGLLVAFNLCYIAPLVAVTVLTAALGSRAAPLLARLRDLVERWGPRLLGVLTACAGLYLVGAGIAGLA
jgi:cytochrome c biogenesis protein CcdA